MVSKAERQGQYRVTIIEEIFRQTGGEAWGIRWEFPIVPNETPCEASIQQAIPEASSDCSREPLLERCTRLGHLQRPVEVLDEVAVIRDMNSHRISWAPPAGIRLQVV